MPSIVLKYGLAIIGGSLITELAIHSYKKWRKSRDRQKIFFYFLNANSYCCLGRLQSNCRNAYCAVLIAKCIVDHMDAAKQSIRVAMYMLTHRPFREALSRATKRGINVKVLIDQHHKKGLEMEGIYSCGVMHIPD